MTRIRTLEPARHARSWPFLVGAIAAGSLASCDNPACVFGVNGCQNLPDGGANEVTATFPDTGEWEVPDVPRVENVFPTGFANPESPVVIVFSETISPTSVQNAFKVVATGGGFGGGTGGVSSLLVGDGRVLVLIPPALVSGAEYEVSFTDTAQVRDLSGAVMPMPTDGVIGTFSVDPEPDLAPKLLMSWPLDESTEASTISEVVTVFDRIIDATTVTSSSWHVLVDGLPPTHDALPEPGTISGIGGNQLPEPRIWTWSSVDPATGVRADLGTEASVSIEMSVGLTKITALDGTELEEVISTFTTFEASPPSHVEILTDPTDAIGIENLDGLNPLMLQVDLAVPAIEGDVLEIFLVGNNYPDPVEPGTEPAFISRQREVLLDEGTASVILHEAELMLVTTLVPLVAQFDDGDVGIAFALRRGESRTALRVLDVDPDLEGTQDAILDLERPEFLRLLGKEEEENVLASDLRELSVAGYATDKLRTVEVVANLSTGAIDNRIGGVLPPLPAVAATGAFLAAPVDVGQIDPAEFPLSVGVIVYDRALNASEPFMIEYTQRGTLGTGTVLPGSGLDVEVRVFDVATLEPLEGARVYSHESDGGVVTAFTTGPVDTDASGFASIPSAPLGATLITVEFAGYDLFTFQGVPTTRLDVPLLPDLIGLASTTGIAVSSGTALSSGFIDNWLADSRSLQPGDSVQLASSANFNPLLSSTEIFFFPPPHPIRAFELGLVTFLSTKDPSDLLDPDAFTPGIFLQSFEVNHPRDPVDALAVDAIGIHVGPLLSGADIDPADVPLGTSPQLFSKPPNHALDFANPDGEPRVSVETFAPSVHGVMTVGKGLAYFDSLADGWQVRAAYSARAKAGGDLVTDLTIEDERYLHVELVDLSGSRSGVRQALSSATGTLSPPGAPALTAPVGTTSGDAYDLEYENVITGSQDTRGLYRVLLVDSVGRRWHLWTLDPPSASGSVVHHVPPISAQGGLPLGSGTVTAFIDTWSWPDFDATDLMFSDIARRRDRFSTAAPQLFSQP
jgi:hypothetical protein